MKPFGPHGLTAVAVLAVLAGIAVATSHPAVPAADSYASTDFGSGGYRGWAALLAREGVTTSRFVLRPIELDDRIDTLVCAQPLPGRGDPNARTVADLAALADWVRAGGRLIYLGRNAALGDAEKRLLALPFFLPDVGPRNALSGPLAALTGSLRELGTDRMLLVEHAGKAELSDGNGDIVARYPLGHGEIVAVVDPVPFANANIAASGNARLAFLIGRPRKPRGAVAFDDGVHGALIDRPWYRALPLGVRVSLALVALAALLGAIGSSLRTGPPVRLHAQREPTSAEFVAALAALYERRQARTAAGAVLARAALAVTPGGDSSLIDRLDAPIENDADLVARAKLAYGARKEFGNGGNGDGRRAAFASRTRTRRPR